MVRLQTSRCKKRTKSRTKTTKPPLGRATLIAKGRQLPKKSTPKTTMMMKMQQILRTLIR
jgi:hypothetical protein